MSTRHAAREERMPSASSRPRKKNGSRIVVPGDRGVKVVRAVTIRRPAHELYAFWRDVENLPRVIRHPVTVVARSRDESHWSVSGAAGKSYEWDSLIINDEPDRLIAWRTREGAAVAHAGTIRFEPATATEGTEVTIQLDYVAPGGKLGQLLGKLAGVDPGQQIGDVLERFKALMESHEGGGGGGAYGAPNESKVAANAPLLAARKLETAEVRARDGVVGRVDDLLFDPETWTVRYLVVDTGRWLAGRRVLLAPHTVIEIAPTSLSVALDRKQISTSPPAAETDAVTREHETRLHEHYQWPPYWAATPLASGVIAPPANFVPPATEDRSPAHGEEAHLRSTRHVRGYRLAAIDGEIGIAEDFLIEPRSWRIAALIVDTNGWLPGGKVLLEPHTIARVSRTEAKIFVDEERAVVKAHPPYSPDQALDAEYLTGLQRHYQHPPLM